MNWLSHQALHYPARVALFCGMLGIALALVMEIAGFCGFFGRSGSLTVSLGVLTFGATASDLLIRSQVARISDKNGDLPFPYSRKNLEKVLLFQTLVIIAGTIQWGFGDLLRSSSCLD